MISALLFINQKGEVIISRFYRGDVDRTVATAFRQQVIASKEAGSKPPVITISNTTFIYTRHGDIYFVCVTKKNVNVAMVFHFMFHMIEVFKAYFGKEFQEDNIRSSFNLVYEILDEVLDYGYPQNSGIDLLKMFIKLGAVCYNQDEQADTLTKQITGAIDWRREGIYYRKNEVFLDVLESVHLLMSSQGNVLRQEVNGKIVMKTLLTGMPECKFGLNDKLIMESEDDVSKKTKGVEIDDITFHKCVKLNSFDADRSITFIPPDGEFELMKYRVTDNIHSPFKITSVYDESSSRVMLINIKVSSIYDDKLQANNLNIKIPVHPNTAICDVQTLVGKATYEPSQKCVLWKHRKYPGMTESSLSITLNLARSTVDKAWISKPPITAEFQVPMFTASGLTVRFLRVFEKSSYDTVKWVRYLSRSGEYQIRIA